MKNKFTLDELSWGVIGALQSMGVEFDFNLQHINDSEHVRERASAEYFWSKHAAFDSKYESETRADNEPAWVSDNWRGVEESITILDAAEDVNWYNRRLKAAYQFVRRRKKHLLPVLKLVVKNGKNRKESICQLAQKNFTRRRECTTAI